MALEGPSARISGRVKVGEWKRTRYAARGPFFLNLKAAILCICARCFSDCCLWART